MTVPIAVWVNRKEMDYLNSALKECAEKGILVAVAKPLYEELKFNAGKESARRCIRTFTSHNDKLGFDYDVKARMFKAQLSNQFSSSRYPEFLRRAAKFHREYKNENYAAYLENAASKFTISESK